MGKSNRFGSEESFKSHRNNYKNKKTKNKSHEYSSIKRNYSDRELNRRIRSGQFSDDE